MFLLVVGRRRSTLDLVFVEVQRGEAIRYLFTGAVLKRCS
jgi:hypothetical protein